MNFIVYMLISNEILPIKTYVGYTNNLISRLTKHNSNKGAKSTKGRKWKIIYKKRFSTKSLAMSYEYYLKKNYILRKKIKDDYINAKIS
jgi:putative endonuclease